MMKKNWLNLALMTALAGVGCGDDGGTTTPMDGGGAADGGGSTEAVCPSGTPDRDSRVEGSLCCARTDNMGGEAYGLRVAYMDIAKPASLANALIQTALNGALVEERFTWLGALSRDRGDGGGTIRTSSGADNGDGTFAFAEGNATGEGDPNRWDPVTLMGTRAGDNITADAGATSFTLPIFDDDGALSIELPAQGLSLTGMHTDEANTCVGEAGRNNYDLDYSGGGDVAGLKVYITVADAMGANLDVPPITDNLCDFLAGRQGTMVEGMPEDFCAANADNYDTWTFAPDSFCDEAGTCTLGAAADCGENTCNAWELEISFAAHGVSISN